MTIQDLLAHPKTNCPECGGTLKIHAPIKTHDHETGECLDCPWPCPNDFHTITPERTERELMDMVFDVYDFHSWLIGLTEVNAKGTRQEMAVCLVQLTIALTKFVNARGIVPVEYRATDIKILDLILLIIKSPESGLYGIQALATAAGIDLMDEVEKHLEGEG